MLHANPSALPSAPERPFVPAAAPAPPLHGVLGAQPVEPLWHERRVERTGLLTRIAIPLAGSAPASPYGGQLAAVLDRRWVGRADLTGGAAIRAVTAEIDDHALHPPTLVLSFTTDIEMTPDALAAPRLGNELRRAMRDLRRGYELPLAA